MHITHQLLLFTAHDQNHFGMGFIAHNAIHHHSTCFLQNIGHGNVGLFIKTCAEFNHRGDFFAIACRFCQYLHNLGIRSATIQGLFNRQYIRIFRRFTQQANHGLERVKRMMQQHIFFFQNIKDGLLLTKRLWNNGIKDRIF